MTCADLEILICDYVDGALAPDDKAEVERHLAECSACAELARDSSAARSFMERAAEVELPPQLLTKLLFDPPWARGKAAAGAGVRNWLGRLRRPMLQPRFAMGMAMTILSFAMLARFVAPGRQLRPADLNPVSVWAELEDRAYRAWERTVKFYDSLRFVYQIRTRLREWQQQQEEEQRLAGSDQETPERKADERRLPVKSPPAQNPASRPDAQVTGKSH